MDMPQNETYENQSLLDVDEVASVSFLLQGSIKLMQFPAGRTECNRVNEHFQSVVSLVQVSAAPKLNHWLCGLGS